MITSDKLNEMILELKALRLLVEAQESEIAALKSGEQYWFSEAELEAEIEERKSTQ